jgi:hypothetical protein
LRDRVTDKLFYKERLVCSLAFFIVLKGSGQQYFQQEVNYDIHASLNDRSHSISARARIQYINNSPAALSEIYFHLWPNAYRDQHTALAKQLLLLGRTDLFFSTAEDRGFIDSLDFKINGESMTWSYDENHRDICRLVPPKPVQPGDTVIITTPFYVKIPDARFSRLGHTGEAYFLTQWYPKPAVFDQKGWHPMPYLDQGEFYSEFGSFDVSITLPSNYLVSATGDRSGDDEERIFLDQEVLETDLHLSKNTRRPGDMLFPSSSVISKTVRFHQDNAHDFAWFADKRFYVRHDSVTLPGTGKIVHAWVYVTGKNLSLWSDAMKYIRDALLFYSERVGEYPYSQVTVVDGTIMAGGGMEYPGITVIGDTETPLDLDIVITHEIGHNLFYGALANNERDEPFMDEGLNSFYEMRYTRQKYPLEKIARFIGRDSTFKLLGFNRTPFWKYNDLVYLSAARSRTDQPLLLPATAYPEKSYGSMIYSKSAVAMDYLMDQLGENKFDSLMRQFYSRYKFKHISYADLLEAISAVNGNLATAFDIGLVNTDKDIDLAVKKITGHPDGSFSIRLRNRTRNSLPYSISGMWRNKVVKTAWYDGFDKNGTVFFPAAEIDEIRIDANETMPDINRKNNSMRTHGIFRKMKPVQFRFLTALEDPRYAFINFIPALGGNYYNGFMAGVVLHNYSFYEKRIGVAVTPLYAFRNKSLAGSAYIDGKIYPRNLFSRITLGTKVKRYAYDIYESKNVNRILGTNYRDLILEYLKIAPFIELELKKRTATSLVKQTISYSTNQLLADSLSFKEFSAKGPQKKLTRSFVNVLSYELVNSRVIDPFSVNLQLQHSATMAKVSATLRQKIIFSPSSNIELRLFGGIFLAGSDEETGYYSFRTSGYQGYHDYAFDYYYMARNEYEGFGHSQFTETDGNLKTPTPLGQTNLWLAALNIKSPKIFNYPVRFFADISVSDARTLLNQKYLWDLGVNLTIWKEIIEIYVPLIYSDDIRQVMELNGTTFPETIRFTLNIHKLGPKSIIQNMLF